MKREIHIFFAALMFYTRIPCPKWVNHDMEYLKDSARYLSLVGAIVGGIGALVFYIGSLLFSTEISLVMSMAATIRTTGAFHEDGFADVCDGFGGGWNKDKIIEIMKDSRLGTFGVTGLILLLGLKFLSLQSIPIHIIASVILVGNVVSRTIGVRMLARNQYVQNNNLAKAGSAAKQLSIASLTTNIIVGLLAVLLLNDYRLYLALLPMLLVEYLMYRFYKKWIGGYNGDCVGAVQQITEVVFYLSLLVIWKFI